MKSLVSRQQKVQIIERAIPKVKPFYLLIKTLHSVISPGTELSLVEISGDKEIGLGYSAVGVVVECGEGVNGYQKEDLVACYGAPYVGHSEYLLVPTTLCAKVPSGVDPKEAALAGIGAIAIHALRVAKLEFGETVAIIGLGLLGQMIAKIATAASYDVVAFDIHSERATMLSGEDNIRAYSTILEMESELERCTKSHGADAVLLCAGGKRSTLTDKSLDWVRPQGKVVIVGDIEPDFPRSKLFSKEAQILISRAGGPGRYDPVYERQAIDYPYGYVRWTEGRNVAEYLRLVCEKRINVQPFLTDEVDFKDVPTAFDELMNKKSTTLTKLINY